MNVRPKYAMIEQAFYPLEIDVKQLFEDRLTECDLSKTKVLSLLNIDTRTFDDLLNGKATQPNLIHILKIADFLELDIRDIIPTILKNQPPENYKALERAKSVRFVGKNFDVARLHKIGFLEDDEDIDYISSRILSFFGYGEINAFEERLSQPLFSRTKRKFSDKMKSFWIASAYQCFKSINNPNEYDRDALKEILVKIKPYSQDVNNGLLTVCKALYNVGVTVIVQSHLTLTQVRGGTFIVNKKPCIVLTDLNKRYTTIWETLIHELYHVLFDFEAIEKSVYRINGDPDLFLVEDKAEDFSIEYFCGYEKYQIAKAHIFNHILVKKYATEWEIHHSFIYSSFRYFQFKNHNKNYYKAFTDHFPDHSNAIKKLKPITWKEDSLSEIAEYIKSIFELKITTDERDEQTKN